VKIGLAIAIETLVNVLTTFDQRSPFDEQLSDARIVRESAAVIANSEEEELIEALKEAKEIIKKL
jgi:hypothetical protein